MGFPDENMKRAEEVVQSFMAVCRTLTRFTQQNAASLGLTLTQMGILNTIAGSPGITLREITERLLLSKSTASTGVDELVRSGLVERETAQNDRREINLKVTAGGKQLSQKSCLNAPSYRAMSSALKKLPEEDIRSLLRIHEKLLGHLMNAETRISHKCRFDRIGKDS